MVELFAARRFGLDADGRSIRRFLALAGEETPHASQVERAALAAHDPPGQDLLGAHQWGPTERHLLCTSAAPRAIASGSVSVAPHHALKQGTIG